jgi:hypothetical protein
VAFSENLNFTCCKYSQSFERFITFALDGLPCP